MRQLGWALRFDTHKIYTGLVIKVEKSTDISKGFINKIRGNRRPPPAPRVKRSFVVLPAYQQGFNFSGHWTCAWPGLTIWKIWGKNAPIISLSARAIYVFCLSRHFVLRTWHELQACYMLSYFCIASMPSIFRINLFMCVSKRHVWISWYRYTLLHLWKKP